MLLTLAALGYVGFVAAYAIQYRDFSVMKAIFMLAGLLGLVMLFIDGGRRGHPLHAAGSIGDGEDGGRLQGSRAPLFLGPLGSELPYAPRHDAASGRGSSESMAMYSSWLPSGSRKNTDAAGIQAMTTGRRL